MHMCTKDGWSLDPHVLPKILELTSIRTRAANKRCLAYVHLRFLQYPQPSYRV